MRGGFFMPFFSPTDGPGLSSPSSDLILRPGEKPGGLPEPAVTPMKYTPLIKASSSWSVVTMVQKPTSDEEEKFIQLEEQELRLKRRQERQLAAIRLKEKAGIAEALHTGEDIAQEAMNLGFDSETARVLPLVPIIQMAWADGKVTNRETDKVMELAQKFGIVENTPAASFLTMLLAEQPSKLFFERVNGVIARIVDEAPSSEINRETILEWSKAVAESSGGFFGLTDPISKEEKELLSHFAGAFGVDKG
jgi:hypothetical protein